MKSSLRMLCIGASASAMLVASVLPASAAISASATPNTGIKNGDTIAVSVSGLTGNLGVYASLCKATTSPMEAPTDCDPDQAHTAWITGTGAQGSSKDSGKVLAVASFTTTAGSTVDCLKETCVIYIRGDHNNRTDYSLIRVLPLNFVAGQAAPAKKTDTPTATLNGTAVKPNVPSTLVYRVPVQLVVKAESGLPVTLKSLTPDCAVDGTTVTALKGAGVCAIAAATSGNDTYAAFTAAINFPFYLRPGEQKVTSSFALKKVVWGKPAMVKAASFTSDMGQDIELTSATPGTCVVVPKVSGWLVAGVARGICSLVATGPADPTKFNSGSVTVTVPVTWR